MSLENKEEVEDKSKKEEDASPPRIPLREPLPEEAHLQPLGTIVSGHRTVSGTVTLTKSFEVAEVSDAPLLTPDQVDAERRRLNTAPAELVVPTAVEKQEKVQEESPSQKASADETPLPAPDVVPQPSPDVDEEEEDEDIKLAKAMALAFEQHPHLTPGEIQELVRKQQSQQAVSAVSPSIAQRSNSLLVPGRLSSMLQSASTAVEESMTAVTASVTAATTTAPTATASQATKKGQPVRTGLRTMGENFKKRVSKANIVVSSVAYKQQMEDGSEKSTSSHHDVPDFPDGPLSTSSAGSTNKQRNLPFKLPSKQGLRPPPVARDIVDKIPSKREIVEKLPSKNNLKLPPVARDILDTAKHAVAKVETVAPPLRPTMSVDTSDDSERSSVLPMSTKSAMAPIRLTGIAWKRRSGLGKYSSTSAWERRRIELQGTKLLYYQAEEADTDVSPTATKDEEDGGEAGNGLNESSDHEGVVVVNKKTTWFEQAAANWKHPSPGSPGARGFLDLAKDKATVQASHGHSGAPSPFAISVKIRGETKWKFCFDHHREQMEWLVALTDVVVQTSVDQYNKALLEAANPTIQSDDNFFPPPVVNEPPSGDEKQEATQHRLWMMDSYSLRSQGVGVAVDVPEDLCNDDDRDAAEASATEASLDTVATAGLPTIDAGTIEADTADKDKVWTVPEKNLSYLAGVLNVALACTRASSTTIDGFWYVVVFANLGMFLCLVKEPDWRRVGHQFQHLRHSLNNPLARSSKKKSRSAVPRAGGGVATKPKKPAVLPVAGTTTVKLENPTDPPMNAKKEMFGGWREMPGDILAVRSHGYALTKKKVPSPGTLYEIAQVDIFESPSRYPDMAKRVKLPKVEFDDGGAPKTWRAPDIFVISIALPTDPPRLGGGSSSDGGGYTVTMYFRMTQETRDILRQVTAGGYDPSENKPEDFQKSKVNAVRLFDEWCRRAPTDPKFMARFKVVPNAHNLKEIGMPGWISKYNGKPFLIKRAGQTGFLYSHPELSCMEFDISLHPFPYVAKKGICFMKESYFKKILVTFGFVIEGRSDDELPECVIGLMQLCYPDPQYAIQADTFFAGTCPKSF